MFYCCKSHRRMHFTWKCCSVQRRVHSSLMLVWLFYGKDKCFYFIGTHLTVTFHCKLLSPSLNTWETEQLLLISVSLQNVSWPCLTCSDLPVCSFVSALADDGLETDVIWWIIAAAHHALGEGVNNTLRLWDGEQMLEIVLQLHFRTHALSVLTAASCLTSTAEQSITSASDYTRKPPTLHQRHVHHSTHSKDWEHAEESLLKQFSFRNW